MEWVWATATIGQASKLPSCSCNDFKSLLACQWCVPPSPPLSPLSVDIDGLHPPTVLKSWHPRSGTHLLLDCTSFAFFCTLISQVPQVVGQCQAHPAHACLNLPAGHHQTMQPTPPSILLSWHHTSPSRMSPILSGPSVPVWTWIIVVYSSM